MFPIKNAVVQYTTYIIIHSVTELSKAHPYQSPLNISRDNSPGVYLNISDEQILLLGYPGLFNFIYSFVSVCQIGRLESSWLIPMLKLRQLEPIAYDHGCQIFYTSTSGDSRASLDSLCWCLATLISKEASCVHMDFLGFSLCPLPLDLLVGTTGKSVSHSCFLASSIYWMVEWFELEGTFKDHLVQLPLWWVCMKLWPILSPIHCIYWCAWAFSSPGWIVSASPHTTGASVPLSLLCWTHFI